MAITIRFPNGQAVTYNDANYITYHGNNTIGRLHKSEADALKSDWWIADVSLASGPIVEAVRPCSVSNPIAGLTPNKAIAYLLANLRSCPVGLVADLKRELRQFNITTGEWAV